MKTPKKKTKKTPVVEPLKPEKDNSVKSTLAKLGRGMRGQIH